MKHLSIILFSFLIPFQLFSQSDSLQEIFEKDALRIDTLRLKVKNIIITGNDVTKPEIILREMSLKEGSIFTLKKYSDDMLNIYNLALFTKVDIIPIPVAEKEITLNVDVKERWYILPLPTAGIEDGEWKKIWVGLNLRWDNFRGRNEKINFGFRLFYNPAVGLRYQVPWIGEKAHLFLSIAGAWSRTRNLSLDAVGKESGNNTLQYSDNNYENIQYRGDLILGRYFGDEFSVFTDFRVNHLRVTQYQPGRTMSTDGVDRYLTIGAGISYDSRDIVEYATKGDYLKTEYLRYGFLDEEINFGRYYIENQSFIPVNLTKTYYLTIASKLYTSIAMGAVIPVYNHELLGYSEDYVRGWKGRAYEGDNVLTVYNELRIPIFKPRYVKGRQMAVIKDIPIIKDLDIRHGLYATLIYDIGTVWYKNENIFRKHFISGVGAGLNFIAPFGYIVRTDWVFRLAKPVVGQFVLSLNAKF